MTKIEKLQAQLATLKDEAQALLDENKVTEANAKLEEIKSVKNAIEIQQEIDNTKIDDVKKNFEGKGNTAKNASFIRAAIKKMCGITLSEKENALLLPTTSVPDGTNGEGFILPQDIQTKINKKIREYKSLREDVGYMQTTALTGSFPVENFETVTELIDFTDGTDGEEASDIKFTNVKYSLSEKAAFLKLSNTLLALTDNDLIAYVIEVFAKKAVITENKIIVATLKSNKTAKALKDWKGLKSSINKDLDPAVLFGTKIVTNQDGFDHLDSALDSRGRPILQPDPTNPTEKRFCGYPVKVYSNAILPTTASKAPIFYGNLAEGVKAVDLGITQFATSDAAGFMSNTTVARLIEFFTAVQCDKSDKCYIYGTLDLSAAAAE